MMFRFSIDRGGTFTDVYAQCPSGKVRVLKLLSEDPLKYSDAPREAIRRVIEEETGATLPSDRLLDGSSIEWIRMGTTVATNALLERKGDKFALVITKGFRDLLHIGNQSRPNIFDLKIAIPEVLYEMVVEVEERVVLHRSDCQLNLTSDLQGTTGENLHLWTKLDEEKLRGQLQPVLAKGITTLSVVLLHSYTYPAHEEAIGRIAMEMGFKHVSLSSKVMPMIKIVPRGFTACADAYLTPCIQQYVQGFTAGFKNPENLKVLFMQSDGGLTPMNKFIGSRAILSGPAGGVVYIFGSQSLTCMQSDCSVLRSTSFDPCVNAMKKEHFSPSSRKMESLVGYAVTNYHQYCTTNQPVIGFDMGGTSTDVSRYDGQYDHVFESTTGGISIQAPQLDINTVAAGGGSVLFFRSGLFVVGPESAGANPGPVCYGKNGPLTVTDANLCLGRLLPEYFPKIFGPGEDEQLNKKSTMDSFEQLSLEVNTFLSAQDQPHTDSMSCYQVAMGFIDVANEMMCRPIRALTQVHAVVSSLEGNMRLIVRFARQRDAGRVNEVKGKGFDTARHVLACFGGAGGQHACSIARILGMSTVFIHRYSGILSAYGLALADVVHEAQEPCALKYEADSFTLIDERIDVLADQCVKQLEKQGFKRDVIEYTPYLHLRYDKTDCALMCSPDPCDKGSQDSPTHGDFYTAFTKRYKREFGFTIPARSIIVDDIRVRGIAKACSHDPTPLPKATHPPTVKKVVDCFFGDRMRNTSVYLLEELAYGHTITGPAIIIDKNSTILLEPECTAAITLYGDVQIEVVREYHHNVGKELDAIHLSIFSHRFMSIAEQMGKVLQRTSISTNIKERLDFSCALFGPDGGLVANAPHIPVHLGAMQQTVQWQMRYLGDNLQPGDVLLSNHPAAGGSHLPDLTVITPVFYTGQKKPVFFVASRGHHADIGGITPGSMPPNSQHLWQEGMCTKSFKLVENGVFQEEGVTELLNSPSQYPGCSGTRNLHDNLSDLRAQVAANQKGVLLVQELIDVYGLDVVQAYMGHIQENSELSVREVLKNVLERNKESAESTDVVLNASDCMDDGSLISLKIEIHNDGSALFDFTGTGPQITNGNCNAPRAVTFSVLIYCLRCMVGHDVPLNQGCLQPIKVIIPEGSILDPADTAAVIGGNVLTCQRVADVVFKAFKICAASQGCMNNTTFGDDTFGYYETVAGGAGAGPSWHGRSGVHTNMTNTRITDPEILERRYPVILLRFELNEGTGGDGFYKGGDGVIRELLFRKPLTLSVLTERRILSPFGLEGGSDGTKGRNILITANGAKDLGGKKSIDVNPEDIYHLETPGGGGFGDPLEV